MPQSPLYLRVLRIARYQDCGVLLKRAGNNPVNFGHIGTGRVDNLRPLGPEPFINIPAHSMGADDNRIPRPCILRALQNSHSLPGQLIHHLRVMDNRSKGIKPFALPYCLVHNIHRAFYAKAEARAVPL